MARRATTIKQIRAGAENVLLLDAGNSLVPYPGNGKLPAEITKGQSSVDLLNRLGYDAVALGEKDLSLGRGDLSKRLAEAKSFKFLSANLIDKSTGKLFAEPYTIKEAGGHKVAIIGITGPIWLPSGESKLETDEFSIKPPLDVAQEYVRRMESQADIIVLLSTAGTEANKAIADQVPGIDVLISGGMEPLKEPLQTLGALVVMADYSTPGHAGRYLGKLDAQFDRAGKMTEQKWQSVELNKNIANDPEMVPWLESLPTPVPEPTSTSTPAS